MTPLTQEWVEKAEGDFASAGRELRSRKLPNYDAACFHAQQCAEKYMKGRLQEAGIAFPKTHNLVELLQLVGPLELSLMPLSVRLDTLGKAAVEIRYPGRTATKVEAKGALATAREVRQILRTALGLPV